MVGRRAPAGGVPDDAAGAIDRGCSLMKSSANHRGKRAGLSLRTRLVLVISGPMIALVALIVAGGTWLAVRHTREASVDATRSIVRAMEQDFQKVYVLQDQS